MWRLNSWNCDQTKIVTKLINSSCTKLKNSNSDKTKQKILKLWQSLTTQIVTKLKTQIATKLNSNCDISYDNSKTQIVIVAIVTVVTVVVIVTSFSKTTWHLDNRWDFLRAAFAILAMFIENEPEHQHIDAQESPWFLQI